jgi:hypothetical protein
VKKKGAIVVQFTKSAYEPTYHRTRQIAVQLQHDLMAAAIALWFGGVAALLQTPSILHPRHPKVVHDRKYHSKSRQNKRCDNPEANPNSNPIKQ